MALQRRVYHLARLQALQVRVHSLMLDMLSSVLAHSHLLGLRWSYCATESAARGVHSWLVVLLAGDQ